MAPISADRLAQIIACMGDKFLANYQRVKKKLFLKDKTTGLHVLPRGIFLRAIIFEPETTRDEFAKLVIKIKRWRFLFIIFTLICAIFFMEPEISYIIYGIPLVMLVVYQTILVHKFSISFPRMENKLPLKEVYSHASNYFGSTYYFILTPICVVLTITIVFFS